MEILNRFGFDIQLFLAQVINFLILAFIFKKFLYGPILKMIANRQKTIEKGLIDAEKAEKALTDAGIEREKIITRASKEAQKILTETKESAEKMRDEIIGQSRLEADKIVSDAKKQSDLELERIKSEGEKIAVSITASLLSKTLKDTISGESQKVIIENTVKKLKKYEN